MQIVKICQCDHEEFNHNFDERLAWQCANGCFMCLCMEFKADNLLTLEKAIGPTVSVQKLQPPL